MVGVVAVVLWKSIRIADVAVESVVIVLKFDGYLVSYKLFGVIDADLGGKFLAILVKKNNR